MNRDQAKALGKLLREKRKELGYSTYDVARAAGVADTTVQRIEQGRFAAPRPNRLTRFAAFLGLSVADLYARAGYLVPDDLPGFEPYLHAKYPLLPKWAVTELRNHFMALAVQNAIPIDPPKPTTEELTDEDRQPRRAS